MLLFSLFLSISLQKSSKESDEEFSSLPISVTIDQMTKTGTYGTSSTNCPSNVIATEPCGKRAWFNPSSQGNDPPTFSYTFRGERYQIYGKYDKNHGPLRVFLDGEHVIDINQGNTTETISNALQYTSDVLPYGTHTLKVEPNGDDIELYKFTYWPSVHAVRVNSTQLGAQWNIESDGIGGLREWANENNKVGIKKIKTLQFSKIWVYGSTDKGHGLMNFSINGEEHFINENTSTRVDNVLVYESELLPLNKYTITFSQYIEDCLLNCIYIIRDPQPTAEPISVTIDQMTKTGMYGTSSTNCPSNVIATEPCGKRAWFNPSSQGNDPPTFSYTFRGERYQIYGKYDKNHGPLRVFLDGEHVIDINQGNTTETISNALQYTSDVIPYGTHTLRVEPNGDDIELYKFTYWPSVHGIRLNSTEMKPLWNVESDGIGGLREWANENSHTAQPKRRTIRFSKIWVYGSTRDIHGDMMFKIDDKEILINQNTTTRVDGVLVYESDYLPLKDYTISFSQHVEDCVFNNIFYLPIAEPTPVPISVPIEQMTITGKHGVVGHGCPKDKFPTEPCGSTVWYNPASQIDNPAIITYKFKGVRFQIYGKYDDSHGIYTLYLDDKLVKEISQVGSQDSTNQLQYTSKLLPYDEHTIKIVCSTGEFELYKFAYWPFSNAKRVNSTDMKPLWNVESDGIGGLREWANEKSHTAQPKTMTLQFSKIWIYGSTRDIHGDMMFKIDDKEILINQNTTARVDGVLVYESDLIPFGNHTISFSQHVEDCVFNGFYYHTLPEPEPDEYILDDGNCNENHRCEKKATNPNQNVQVYVKVTKFNGFNNDDNGGAIHIVDAALKVNQSDFDKCTSNNGGGGAIYVSNSYEITNEYVLESLNFNECSAKYGGAVYLYASSKKINASITSCFFKGNEAVGASSDDKFGGSAIFMSVFNGYLLYNKFRGNKGQGGSVKLINDFKPSSNSLRVLSNEGFVLISKCEFQIEENSDCSLFYLRGNNGPAFEVSNCKFSGSLAKDSHFIDGMVVSTSSPQLVVRSCRFASDFKKAFKFDRSNSFLKIDKDSQVFESKGSDDKKWRIICTLVLPIVGVLAVIAILLAVIVPKKLSKKETLNVELPTEMKDSLL